MLIGRARHQAGALSTELRKLGATVLEIPFIEIRKPRSFGPLDSALQNITSYDWLILTSVKRRRGYVGPAGQAPTRRSSASGRARLQSSHKEKKRDAALAAEGRRPRMAAIGPATKKAIEQRGVCVDIVPKEYIAESVVRSLRSKVKGVYWGPNGKGNAAREKWLLPPENLRRLAKLAELNVFTGRVRRELDYTLHRWKVRDFFQKIVTVENVKRPKPAPDGLLRILNGRDPGSALYVGDNVDDALAARAARIPFVGILLRRSEERRQRGAMLRKLGAVTILSDISELERWLKRAFRGQIASHVLSNYPPGRPIVSTKENTVPLQDTPVNPMISSRGGASAPHLWLWTLKLVPAAARAFVRSLNILLKFARMYDFGHPRTSKQFETAWVELHMAIGSGAENESGLLLGVSGDQLLLDGTPLESAAAEKSFARMLSAAGIASIHFSPRVTQGSLARFVRGFPTGTGAKPIQLAEQLKAALQGDPDIHVNEVCFVPADSAVARSTVAAQLAAHTFGLNSEKSDELFNDPQKLLQLIIAAEGYKGRRRRREHRAARQTWLRRE